MRRTGNVNGAGARQKKADKPAKLTAKKWGGAPAVQSPVGELYCSSTALK